jgi:hypothetical protein
VDEYRCCPFPSRRLQRGSRSRCSLDRGEAPVSLATTPGLRPSAAEDFLMNLRSPTSTSSSGSPSSPGLPVLSSSNTSTAATEPSGFVDLSPPHSVCESLPEPLLTLRAPEVSTSPKAATARGSSSLRPGISFSRGAQSLTSFTSARLSGSLIAMSSSSATRRSRRSSSPS